jgi:2,4-dienoyl-CoA reductase-like NADH-dependent reductase (Old Yellow Enzyme family)
VGISIIGEVQGNPHFAEKPGNLVLNKNSDLTLFQQLTDFGSVNQTGLWAQLGHAGAMAFAPISTPAGPSVINAPGLVCGALTKSEIEGLPQEFAATATLAKRTGFGGVEIHAAHGFLLSQFLSPLFNTRTDKYGGSLTNRMAILLDIVDAVRSAVGSDFPIGLKLNTSDQLEGGFEEAEALQVVEQLDRTSLDLLDLSGGTYFPGATSASDRRTQGPYFVEFAGSARKRTTKPLMLTGGFKTRDQAFAAVSEGNADLVGLARALIVVPNLPNLWRENRVAEPEFPDFKQSVKGGITAWYTMAMRDIAGNRTKDFEPDLGVALHEYNERDRARAEIWKRHFE